MLNFYFLYKFFWNFFLKSSLSYFGGQEFEKLVALCNFVFPCEGECFFDLVGYQFLISVKN